MRIFVTGAAGYIGNAVAKAFRSKGHTVYGLIRSEEQSDDLIRNEIIPIIGELSKPESFLIHLDHIEAVVHCAFEHSEEGVKKDKTVIELLIQTLKKSSTPRIFIYTSGIWIYGSKGNEMVDESSELNPIEKIKWRPSHEELVMNANSSNLKTLVIRPGIVYGKTGGLMKMFFKPIQLGFVPLIEEGKNHLSMIHVVDLAHAYVSVVEKELNGVILNVVGDATPTFKEVVEAITSCSKSKTKVKIVSKAEGQQFFGPLVDGLSLNIKADNSRIKRLLKWQTHHAPFINEVEIYYQAWLAQQDS